MKLLKTSLSKSRPDFISVMLYFFWSFGINDSNTFSYWELYTDQACVSGRESCCTFIISHEQTRYHRDFPSFILVWLISKDRFLPEFSVWPNDRNSICLINILYKNPWYWQMMIRKCDVTESGLHISVLRLPPIWILSWSQMKFLLINDQILSY